MTQAATSEHIGENVGGADYHMEYSGTCDVVGADDRETLQKARALLSYLPSNFRERPPFVQPTDAISRDISQLETMVPDDYESGYDMHDVIQLLVDDGIYFEIKDNYARQLITCFCRFNGHVAGLVANNPGERGGMLEIDACDKYYRFLQVLDAYHIPLVTLTDTPPVVPGEDQESKGLLRHAGKLLDTYVTATIPKISIILREAYGDAGSMVMGGVKGMGGDLTYAWPIARFAVEASKLDYRTVYGKGVAADAYEGYLNRSREKVEVFEAARSWSAQMVDEIIEPRDTRKKIIEALEITKHKQTSLPKRAKSHGTGPT
jgi:propionyl-CoA carboxylase beta chain